MSDTSVLTPESTELVDQLIATLKIKSNQKFYDQNVIAEQDTCGTVGCMAGWIYFIKNGQKKHDELVKQGWVGTSQIMSYAENQLRLSCGTKADTELLFGEASEWPDELRNEYEDAITPAERVAVAIRALESFKVNGDLSEFEDNYYDDYNDYSDDIDSETDDEDENEDF